LFETEISRQRKVSKSERNKEKAVQAKDPEKFEIDSKMGGGGREGGRFTYIAEPGFGLVDPMKKIRWRDQDKDRQNILERSLPCSPSL
jgi:hypothetical protein